MYSLELYKNLCLGESFRAPDQAPHSKVSMDLNPHYDLSSGESMSTQPPWFLPQGLQIKPALLLGDN